MTHDNDQTDPQSAQATQQSSEQPPESKPRRRVPGPIRALFGLLDLLLFFPLKSVFMVALTLFTVASWPLTQGDVPLSGDYRAASRESVGLAPSPEVTPEAVVQVYAAPAFAWRGAYASHTWIAAKRKDGERYTRYEVIGFRLDDTGSAVVRDTQNPPDGKWYGAEPILLDDIRGPEAEAIVAQLDAAATAYPYAQRYLAWPGPNSNTFTAWMIDSVDGLDTTLPPNALGKLYTEDLWTVDTTENDIRGEITTFAGLYGLIGSVADRHSLELSVFGLAIGHKHQVPIIPGRMGP